MKKLFLLTVCATLLYPAEAFSCTSDLAGAMAGGSYQIGDTVTIPICLEVNNAAVFDVAFDDQGLPYGILNGQRVEVIQIQEEDGRVTLMPQE